MMGKWSTKSKRMQFHLISRKCERKVSSRTHSINSFWTFHCISLQLSTLEKKTIAISYKLLANHIIYNKKMGLWLSKSLLVHLYLDKRDVVSQVQWVGLPWHITDIQVKEGCKHWILLPFTVPCLKSGGTRPKHN